MSRANLLLKILTASWDDLIPDSLEKYVRKNVTKKSNPNRANKRKAGKSVRTESIRYHRMFLDIMTDDESFVKAQVMGFVDDPDPLCFLCDPGIAICSKDDTFDLRRGLRLAAARAVKGYIKAFVSHIQIAQEIMQVPEKCLDSLKNLDEHGDIV